MMALADDINRLIALIDKCGPDVTGVDDGAAVLLAMARSGAKSMNLDPGPVRMHILQAKTIMEAKLGPDDQRINGVREAHQLAMHITLEIEGY
jgi:hypothetical protein